MRCGGVNASKDYGISCGRFAIHFKVTAPDFVWKHRPSAGKFGLARPYRSSLHKPVHPPPSSSHISVADMVVGQNASSPVETTETVGDQAAASCVHGIPAERYKGRGQDAAYLSSTHSNFIT